MIANIDAFSCGRIWVPKNIEDVKKMRRDKIQEGIRNRVDPYANDFMAAKGGLATLPRKVAKPTNYGIVGTKVYNN